MGRAFSLRDISVTALGVSGLLVLLVGCSSSGGPASGTAVDSESDSTTHAADASSRDTVQDSTGTAAGESDASAPATPAPDETAGEEGGVTSNTSEGDTAGKSGPRTEAVVWTPDGAAVETGLLGPDAGAATSGQIGPGVAKKLIEGVALPHRLVWDDGLLYYPHRIGYALQETGQDEIWVLDPETKSAHRVCTPGSVAGLDVIGAELWVATGETLLRYDKYSGDSLPSVPLSAWQVAHDANGVYVSHNGVETSFARERPSFGVAGEA